MSEATNQQLEQRLLASLKGRLADYPRPVFLALSGGVDSMLLLEALARLSADVGVLHVHHGLQPEADHWADFCEQQARERGYAFTCERVQLQAGGNVEARARAARYAAFAQHVGAGSLLTAQHRDDQAETLLLGLMRAAGVTGLAAMSPQRKQGEMTLCRPLLDVSRADIERLANHWQLQWVEDPSNQQTQFSRNWLRQRLLPLWRERQPDIGASLAQSASHLGDAAELLDEVAAQDMALCQGGEPGLAIAELASLTPVRQRNLLRYWLGRYEPFRPGGDWLDRLEIEVINAAADRQPQLRLNHGVVGRFRSRLYWLPLALFDGEPVPAQWRREQALKLGLLELTVGAPSGQIGKPLTPFQQGSLSLPAHLTPLEVRFAQGGERIYRHGQHQRVAECWRVAGVPSWSRRWLPLFYYQGELVAVAAIGVADGYQGANDSQPLHWRLAL